MCVGEEYKKAKIVGSDWNNKVLKFLEDEVASLVILPKGLNEFDAILLHMQ